MRGLQLDRVVGKTVVAVEPHGKHLLIRFSNSLSLHTHMRMVGSWHVYSVGERWKKPEFQAKVTIECGDRLIVCFSAPVVELLTPSDEARHAGIQGLGPDVLDEGPLDFNEVRRRAALRAATMSIGELLLDQQVVAGIGNIYRCESLFLARIAPETPHGELDAARLDNLVGIAARLMRANVGPTSLARRTFGAGGNQPWVYGRGGRPCRACGTPIKKGRLGAQARDIFWCPTCQNARVGKADEQPADN